MNGTIWPSPTLWRRWRRRRTSSSRGTLPKCVLTQKIKERLNSSRVRCCCLLWLRLFGDILDGVAFLADDGSHKLSRHEHAQWEVVLSGAWRSVASWWPGLRGALVPGSPTPTTRAGSLDRWSSIRVHDIWHLEGVVVELVSCQLLDGSGW